MDLKHGQKIEKGRQCKGDKRVKNEKRTDLPFIFYFLYRLARILISTLLYGSETWATTNREEKRLDVFDNRCLRRILGIKWFHRVTPQAEKEQVRRQRPCFLRLED